MEYPAKYDFFLAFKAIQSDKGEFLDYILINYSNNYKNITNKKLDYLLGSRLSELFFDNDNILLTKDLYYHMVPNTLRKFERYIDDLDRWYLINLFSDTRDYLYVFYTDITRLKRYNENIRYEYIKTENIINYDFFKDKLTGLFTKDFFEAELIRLDTERQLPMSIIIGDLNGLKLINDAFGHHMGDKALKIAGNIMKNTFRKEDIVSRFRGDEFVVLLPRTTQETSLEIIKRLQLQFENHPLDFLKLSMSFGTATKNSLDEDISQIMKSAEEDMYFNKLKESRKAKHDLITFLKDKLVKISYETEQHFERLYYICNLLADKLNISEIEKEELKLLCEYHDIGKACIPNYILHKQEPLKKEEWAQIRRHSEIGYHIMKASSESLAIDELILMHHERWDGNGYPGLLKGDEIPLVVRIFTICEAYEAMVNYRPYKEQLTNQEALKEIEDNAGTQFDPEIAKIFTELMKTEDLKII